MTEKELNVEACRFRTAIEMAKNAGEFTPKQFKSERMNNFPKDCCDDTSDLFAHYLFLNFKISSRRIIGEYRDDNIGCTCFHSWLVVNELVVDLTGDQFEDDPSVPIKAEPVYVGENDDFHKQFTVVGDEFSIGIESLSSSCFYRMKGLYGSIEKYIR